jgi:hypothetical protein
MALHDLLKEFNLDVELIARDRDVSVGLAKAYERTAVETRSDRDVWFKHMMSSATEYRRAGAHSLLLSDQFQAAIMFEQAGQAYVRLQRPYALMMFWCARELTDVVGEARDFEFSRIDRNQLTYLLLTSAADREAWESQKTEALAQSLSGSQNSPVGLLGMPVGAYMDLAYTLARREFSQSTIVEALLPFLLTYSTVMRRCMEDDYHWRQMVFPFHPAEPDVLSILFCVEATLRRRQQSSLLRILESLPLFPLATSFLYNAISERFLHPEERM